MTDSLGNIVTLENGTVMEMGDRSYRLEENGAIRYVKRRDVSDVYKRQPYSESIAVRREPGELKHLSSRRKRKKHRFRE